MSMIDEQDEPLYCPKCGNEDVDVNSSREMQVSVIQCFDCGFEKQYKVCEEDAIKKWNKIRRKPYNKYDGNEDLD